MREWAEYAVVPACKYLGLWIGPAASVHMNWEDGRG